MAQQMITLEEAAERLGISPEEMKKRLKTDPEFKRLSQIRDGATVRFKLSAIEELARQLGMASEQDLPLAPAGGEPGSDDFKVPGRGARKKAEEAPLEFGSSEDDVFSLAEEAKPAQPKSSGKLAPGKPAAPKMSDSSAGSSDSDVRLDGGKPKPDAAAVPTEEISLDLAGQGSAVIKGGSSAKLSAPRPSPASGKLSASDAKKVPGEKPPADSSEFELSLDADSDFELQMNPDAGDEVELGALPKDKVGGGRSSKSGINLRDPADSGIPLDKTRSEEAAKGDDSSGPEPDFELSLDSSAASGSRLGAPKSGKLVLDADSDSEFELTLDDSGGSSIEQAALGDVQEAAADKGDIFETDFEIPPMDESGSEAVPADSDTDVEGADFVAEGDAADEPSESEVVLLGDEDEAEAPAAKAKAKKKGKKTADDEVDVGGADDEDASASKALKGAKGKRRDEDEEDEEEEAVPAGAVVERPTKPWGVVPVLLLAPTVLVVFLGAIMGYELLNTMWGYQQPRKPAAPLVRGIASTFDMELRDQ